MTQYSDHRLADREARRNKEKGQISESAYKGADESKDAMVKGVMSRCYMKLGVSDLAG